MLKRISSFLLLFCLTFLPLASSNNWLQIGVWEDQTSPVYLSIDIRPVALPNGDIVPYLYTSHYRINAKGLGIIDERDLTDLISRKSFEFPTELRWERTNNTDVISPDTHDWIFDPQGVDGFIDGAYILKNKTKIAKRAPYILTEEQASLMGDRTPTWSTDPKGWLQVYRQPDKGEAWVHTPSLRLIKSSNSDFDNIQVLVQRQNLRSDGSVNQLLSYEEYNPNNRTRRPLKVWEDTESGWKPLLFKTDSDYPVPILSQESMIATVAFDYVITHPTETNTEAVDLSDIFINSL